MSARRGVTLVELVLAVGLFSMLAVAVLALFDSSITIWNKTETRRDLVEAGSAVGELFARDVGTLEVGPRGDLLLEWLPLDADGDGVNGAVYPRVRLVRRVSEAEVERLVARFEPPPDEQRTSSTLAGAVEPYRGQGLLEVVWVLHPQPSGPSVDEAVEGPELVLMRGERLLGDPETLSFFDERAFDDGGRALPGMLEEVTGGVLWFGVGCAATTTLLDRGWDFGTGVSQAARSWDARGADRPDPADHLWNEPHPWSPRSTERPLYPRRVRLELEIERSSDRKRRTRLVDGVDSAANVLRVRDPSRLPREGEHVLVGEEWMEVRDVTGSLVTVTRGARGTTPAAHPEGARLAFGQRLLREIPLSVAREEWGL